MDVDEDTEMLKRKGPETRTVVIAPETKKSKLEAVMDVVNRERIYDKAHHNLLNLASLTRHRQVVPLDFPDELALLRQHEYDSAVGRPHGQMSLLEQQQADDISPTFYVNHNQHLFSWPGKVTCDLYADLSTGQAFKVDEETDNIGESEAHTIWPQVEESDRAEVKQFVDTKSFKKMHKNAITDDVVVVDAIWVRKWKRHPDGSRKVKSRLCARGCFDSQRESLSTRSTTATRLSQRILMSTSATQDFDVESWDISGAFLKGLTFEQIRELLRSKGISAPLRKVALVVPLNVWRHLAALDPAFQVPGDRYEEYILICLKPVYGLNDAPLAWQLCLHQHFEATGGIASLMDENLFYWPKPNKQQGIQALATTHVDDVGAGSKPQWLMEQYSKLCVKFGKVTRQQLPFVHCGVLYSRSRDGFSMTQDDFCSKLKPAPIPAGKRDDEALCAEEVTHFRSILGGLLWLTATRVDLIADVCLLQSKVTQAKVEHLKQANLVVKRAKAEIGQGLGLHYRRLTPPFKLACIHDSSAAGNVRHYAQEGVLVLLMEDRLKSQADETEKVLSNEETKLLCGKAHLLWGHGAKAKRISYSTSHAETLAAISGLEASSLITVRLAELLYMEKKPTISMLLRAQETGLPHLPVDDFTDCRDFFELASGDKSISQDKGQRLYILAFREARLHGRVRWLVLTPTECMTADGLTKSMVAPPLMELLSTGMVNFHNQGDHRMTLRRLPRLQQVEERHLDMTDKEIIKQVSTLGTAFACTSSSSRPTACILAATITLASASTTTSTAASTTTDDGSWHWLIMTAFVIIGVEWMIWGSMQYWWWKLRDTWFFPRTSTTSSTTTTTTSSDEPGDETLAPVAMDVDSAALDAEDKDDDVLQLMAEVKKLKLEVEHQRNLRENAYRTIERLETKTAVARVGIAVWPRYVHHTLGQVMAQQSRLLSLQTVQC